MPDAGDRSAGARPPRAWEIESPLVALWLLLPGCIWWIDFGAAWIFSGNSRWRWGPIFVALGLWSLGTFRRAWRRPAGPSDSLAHARASRTPLAVGGTIAYLLAGASFLFLLGPGIAPVRSPIARGFVGALMITCAWTGWTALHPGARRLALRTLVRLFRRT